MAGRRGLPSSPLGLLAHISAGRSKNHTTAEHHAGELHRDELLQISGLGVLKFGAGDGARTRNFQLGKLTLYH